MYTYETYGRVFSNSRDVLKIFEYCPKILCSDFIDGNNNVDRILK